MLSICVHQFYTEKKTVIFMVNSWSTNR